jgi:hypothetical protein
MVSASVSRATQQNLRDLHKYKDRLPYCFFSFVNEGFEHATGLR